MPPERPPFPGLELGAMVRAMEPRVLPEAPDPDVQAAVRPLVEAAGPTLKAAIFFGSRKSGARPAASPMARTGVQASAYDFFAVTSDDRAFYGALHEAGRLRRRPGLVAALNKWMPPNALSVRAADAEGAPARVKCSVLTLARLQRETSPDRWDHFCIGRLFQPVEVVHAADAAAREAAFGCVLGAHVQTFTWVRPFLPARFDAEAYCRTLLRTSFSWEVRPEPSGRTEALYAAQRDYLIPVYGALLDALRQAGELREEGGGYALARPVGAGERLRTRAYFLRSMVRATARWAKYMVTFEDWLDFIVSKAQRHTGRTFDLTPRERRWPLLFLWPRVFRYLREKDHP